MDVELDRVSAGYGGDLVLHEVSLRAPAGTLTALVGPSGAGKSTLAALLPRLIEPVSGTITLNGIDHRHLPLEVLRELVAVVRQEPFVFAGSVFDNIAFGRPGAGHPEVLAAAHAANAHEFIQTLPSGYATPVGDGGWGLSVGQRQRLAIARALLKDAPVLVLDEPTSALDTRTEAAVLHAVDRLMQGRTVLVIAHRLSTVRAADTILVLDHGRITEHGTHDQLLHAHGLYHDLATTHLHDETSRGAA